MAQIRLIPLGPALVRLERRRLTPAMLAATLPLPVRTGLPGQLGLPGLTTGTTTQTTTTQAR